MIRRILPTSTAMIAGILVLIGYLTPGQPWDVRATLIDWAVIVAAFAFLLGFFNILQVHLRRLGRVQHGGFYSLFLLLAVALATFTTVAYGPTGRPVQQMLSYVISPLGASLAALVVFTLTLAAFRQLRTRRSLEAVGFIAVVILALLTATPLTLLGGTSLLGDIRDWLMNVLGMAGMRGLLLGAALGTLITALRILMGVDRPHSES